VNALLQTVVGDLLGYLYILHETLTDIGGEFGCIDMYLKAEAVNHSDLCGLQGIELGHALDLSEFHIVAILEFVTLIFMHCNN
jgi:hypothetical protein